MSYIKEILIAGGGLVLIGGGFMGLVRYLTIQYLDNMRKDIAENKLDIINMRKDKKDDDEKIYNRINNDKREAEEKRERIDSRLSKLEGEHSIMVMKCLHGDS